LDEEQRLIARAQQGDERAYEALVRQYQEVAFRAAYLITHDEHDAADAAQDGFLRAYDALPGFQLGRPLRPWLLRIVTNLALNRRLAAQRRARMTERYTHHTLVETAGALSIDGHVARREQQRQLLEAVEQLPPDQRRLIALRYFLELPEAEVAETLKIPIGTVKSRLHRTLARLRAIIQADYPDLIDLIQHG